MIERVYAARVAGDELVAGASEPVPGGVRLRSADLPGVRDYNGVLLAPGAPVEVPDDVSRVIAFDPPAAPEGWSSVPLTAMAFAGPMPPAPTGPVAVTADALRDARAAVWGGFGVEGAALDEMLAMQARQAAAGQLFAIFEGDRPVGWAQVITEVVDDVFVEPDVRGRGLGRLLTLATMAAGGRYLTVEADNRAAVALYRGLGFEDAGLVLHLTRG